MLENWAYGVKIHPREVQKLLVCNCLHKNNLKLFLTKVIAFTPMFLYHLQTMKKKLWISLITYLAYCIDKKYLIHDRDTLFTKEFRRILKDAGVKPIRTLKMAPHLNPIAERFVRSIKSECLNRMLIFGERHLEYLVHEYIEHYYSVSYYPLKACA